MARVAPAAVFLAEGSWPPDSTELYQQWKRMSTDVYDSQNWIDSCDPPAPRLYPTTYCSPRHPFKAASLPPLEGAVRMEEYLSVADAADAKRMLPSVSSPRWASLPHPPPHSNVRRMSTLPVLSPRDAARAPLPHGVEQRCLGQAQPIKVRVGTQPASELASPRRQVWLAREAELVAIIERALKAEEYDVVTQTLRAQATARLERIRDEQAARDAKALAENMARAQLLREATATLPTSAMASPRQHRRRKKRPAGGQQAVAGEQKSEATNVVGHNP